MATANETVAEKEAREAREAAVKAAAEKAKADAHDADVAKARAKETKEQREKREAEEALAISTAAQIGQVEQCRVQLARAKDIYDTSVKGIAHRLAGLVSTSGDSDVAKAAAAVSKDYEIDLNAKGLTQPPTPKGASPFAEPVKK